MAQTKLRIIPLGGLGEIGKNMMVIECDDDIIVIDCGLMFPQEDMLGVDLVIPDVTYLLQHRDRVRGILITHGHEDHIGAIAYILKQINVPVYSTGLSNGLISLKLKEHHLLDKAELHVIPPGGRFTIGALEAEFFRVNHSIPDAVGIALHTPLGTIIHTGDFKLDHTPVDGHLLDMPRLAALGSAGVLLLMSDSTYAEVPGYTPSEQVVGEALDRIIGDAEGRVIIACFASLISRVQQIVDASERWDRRVLLAGRSMMNNVKMAMELGYLKAPPGIFMTQGDLRKLPPEQVTIIVTGSQGEPTAVLARIANKDHREIRVIPGDTFVLSSTPIPGNEELVARTIDNLFRQGARVLYSAIAQVHVHGHASQEELKLMLSLTKPRYFVPVHGEYRHLVLHSQLAASLSTAPEESFVMVDGDVLEIDEQGARLAGRIPCNYIYVDGLRVGDISSVVLRDRRVLSRDGILMVVIAVDKQTGKVVGRPDVVSRGFAEADEADDLLERTRDVVLKAIDRGGDHIAEWGYITAKVKETVARFIYEETHRRPMILPVPVEV